ncbi:MAG TPA: NADH-quinone oxidoreductase subunit NuoD, partial [Candidatus Altiarchaeales archaeon]|nr:NADH-quinone oxidoreductase subunit NuoD [Candidatus Altiarchaeales archaeon]
MFELITGGRVYPTGYICPGGVRRDLPESAKERIPKVLDKIEKMIDFVRAENPANIARLKGIGVLKLDDAIR